MDIILKFQAGCNAAFAALCGANRKASVFWQTPVAAAEIRRGRLGPHCSSGATA